MKGGGVLPHAVIDQPTHHVSLEPPSSDADTANGVIRRRLWVETGVVVAFWVCVFLLTIGERATGPGAPSSLWSLGLVHTAFENVLWLAVTPGFFWLTRRSGLERGTWPGSVLACGKPCALRTSGCVVSSSRITSHTSLITPHPNASRSWAHACSSTGISLAKQNRSCVRPSAGSS